MKMKPLFYWRILVLVIMVLLLSMKVISLETFLTIIGGIIIFVGIPEIIQVIMNKKREEN